MDEWKEKMRGWMDGMGWMRCTKRAEGSECLLINKIVNICRGN